MPGAPLYIVDIIGQVVAAVATKLNRPVLYEYGRSIQITTQLQALTNGIDTATRNSKFPLFALFQDFPENNGATGYYCTVTIPKIVIATLTVSTDPPPIRYTKTFKPVLYPIYQEFLNQLVRHSNIVANDPGAIPHVKWDRPGHLPDKDGSNEYLDAIEIQNLQLTFKQVNPCKQMRKQS